jgi:hypothetical protein
LGRILSKGYVEGSSKLAIDEKLRPHLELLLSSQNEQSHKFHDAARDLLGKLDRLQTLPLFVSHFGLNDVNIMVDDNCEKYSYLTVVSKTVYLDVPCHLKA